MVSNNGIKLQYTRGARQDLDTLELNVRRRILKKLEFFCFESDPMKHATALSGALKRFYRFRVGVYRIIFDKDSKGRITIITILQIGLR